MKLCLISLYVILIYVIYKIFNTFKPFRKSIIEGNAQISGVSNRNKHYAPDLNRPHIVENEDECANSSVLLRYGNKKLCIPINGIYHTSKSGCNGTDITIENNVSGCPTSFKIPTTKMVAFTGNSDKCHIIQNPIQWHGSLNSTLNTQKYLGDKNTNCSSFRITDNDPSQTGENIWKYKACVTSKMHDNEKALSFKDDCKNPNEKYGWMYKFWTWADAKSKYLAEGKRHGEGKEDPPITLPSSAAPPEKCKILCDNNTSCKRWHYNTTAPTYKGCYLFSGELPKRKTIMNNGKYSNNKTIFVGKDYHSGVKKGEQKQGNGFFYKWSEIKNFIIFNGNLGKKACEQKCIDDPMCTHYESCRKSAGCAGCYLMSFTWPFTTQPTPDHTKNQDHWAENVKVLTKSKVAKHHDVSKKKPIWSVCASKNECGTNHCQQFYSDGTKYCMLASDDITGSGGKYGKCWKVKHCGNNTALKRGWGCRYDRQCKSDECDGNVWGADDGLCE